MTDFSASVRKWVDQAKEKSEQVFQEIAFEAVNRVKELTPVDTGFLRANWVDTLAEDAIEASPSPVVGLAIAQLEIGDIIYIVNPVRYARRIEYGFYGEDALGRTYNVEGRHMAEQTVTELPGIAQRVLLRSRR